MRLPEALGEIMRYAPFSMTRRAPSCFVVDELQSSADYFSNLYPEEVHRIEVFTDGRMNMVRVYTREFMAGMITSDQRLKQPGFVQATRGFMGDRTPMVATCY